MLVDLISQDYGIKEDYNCAERILAGANRVYNLGIDANAVKLSSGFGGGMAVGSLCGAVASAIMVLGILFVEKRAHQSPEIKDLTQEFLDTYKKEMGDVNCLFLKDKYFNEETKCRKIIEKAAQILDDIIERKQKS